MTDWSFWKWKTLPGQTAAPLQLPEAIALQKLAETFVLTSQGIPFLFAGDEMMRNKKGVRNSYRSPDEINAIDWGNKTLYREVFDYIKNFSVAIC